MTLLRGEVFTPGSFPEHTYVECAHERREESLRRALESVGQVVSLAGPSKSGKTVLVQKVVGRENLISVQGAGIERADDVWDRVLDWMEAPVTIDRIVAAKTQFAGEIGGTVAGGVPLVARASADAKVSGQVGMESASTRAFGRRGLRQVVKEISGSDYVILLDDFHYIPKAVQGDVARSLKAAVQDGVRVAAASVLHRGDDVIRANPDLRGRVRILDLGYWPVTDLRRIAEVGFNALNVSLPPSIIDAFALEAGGSPQLLQLICLEACVELSIREKQRDRREFQVEYHTIRDIFKGVSAIANFRSMVDVLSAGPKSHGASRKSYRFTDDARGDVYHCILRSLGTNPPAPLVTLAELHGRTTALCAGECPPMNAVGAACEHLGKMARATFPGERAIEWDEEKQLLAVADPYFLFYLRWSGHLSRLAT